MGERGSVIPVTDATDVDELAPGPLLEFPEEPGDLRIGLRDALLAGGDWRDG